MVMVHRTRMLICCVLYFFNIHKSPRHIARGVCMYGASSSPAQAGGVCMYVLTSPERVEVGLRHRRREPQSRLRQMMADAAGRPPALGSRHGPSPRVRGHGSGEGVRSGRMLAGGMYVSSWPVERLVHLGYVSMAEPASAACAAAT